MLADWEAAASGRPKPLCCPSVAEKLRGSALAPPPRARARRWALHSRGSFLSPVAETAPCFPAAGGRSKRKPETDAADDRASKRCGCKKLSLGFFPSARSARALLFSTLGEEAGALWGQPVETKAHAKATRAGDVGDRRCGGEAFFSRSSFPGGLLRAGLWAVTGASSLSGMRYAPPPSFWVALPRSQILAAFVLAAGFASRSRRCGTSWQFERCFPNAEFLGGNFCPTYG